MLVIAELLIAPVWNRNLKRILSDYPTDSRLLIAPVWNRNR